MKRKGVLKDNNGWNLQPVKKGGVTFSSFIFTDTVNIPSKDTTHRFSSLSILLIMFIYDPNFSYLIKETTIKVYSKIWNIISQLRPLIHLR